MTIPVDIIGGYLGAGKTTLINELLRKHDVTGFAIMVNDFGAINVDAELLRESADGRVRSFANGCICCSIGEDFGAALDTLRAQPEAVSRVLVEASGVATPVNLVRQSRTPGFEPRGCLVVVDADCFQRKRTDKYVGRLLEQQVQEANWLLVNRGDAALVTKNNTTIPVISQATALAWAWPTPAAPTNGPNTSTPAFTTRSLRQTNPVEKRHLVRLLQELPTWVERVKGFVETPAGSLLVQQTTARYDVSPVTTDTPHGLVFIVPDQFDKSLDEHLSEQWGAWQRRDI